MPGWSDRLFGTEKEQFARGVGKRRKETAMERIGVPQYTSDSLLDMVGPGVPMMGMTRFIKPGSQALNASGKMTGLTDKDARIKATKEFTDRLGLWGPNIEAVATQFAERYPRIAAHMSPLMADMLGKSPKTLGITGAGMRAQEDIRKTPVMLKKGQRPDDLLKTIFHEGTHVAQELGLASKGGLMPTYEAGRKALKKLGASDADAYTFNPPEISARNVAERKMGSKKLRPFRIGPEIDALVQKLPAGSPERIELGRLRSGRR